MSAVPPAYATFADLFLQVTDVYKLTAHSIGPPVSWTPFASAYDDNWTHCENWVLKHAG